MPPQRPDRAPRLRIAAGVERGSFRLEVDLGVAAGETLAVMGPNGAGKTTLLRAFAGLTPVADGSVSLGDVVWDRPGDGVFVPAGRRRAPVVFQDHRLFPHLSVLDNVAYGRRVGGAGRDVAREHAAATLARLGLEGLATRRPDALSGGQAQRVAVARALACDPEVLLLDEPLAALDVGARQEVRAVIGEVLREFDRPAVVVTHDVGDAASLADRLVVVEGGRVVQAGRPLDVAAAPATPWVERLVDSAR